MPADRRLAVAYDATSEDLGAAGAARYTRDLRRALVVRDDVIVHPLRSPRSPLGRAVDGVVREAVWYPAALGAAAALRRARVVHCPAPLAPVWCPAPWLMTIHDLLPLAHPGLFTRANALHFRLVVARRARRAGRILVGTEHMRGEVVRVLGVRPERVALAPYGIDPRFRPVAGGEDALRARLGIPPGPFVLAVGTLEPRKNLRRLMRAFAEVRRRGTRCTLVAVGGAGWRADEIEADMGRAGADLVRPGRVGDDDLAALYSACACFAFPSLYEGFGFPVLEAMACGAPVVSSNRSSLPEVAGGAAALVDPLDVPAIAGALEEVLGDPSRAAGLRAAGLARSAEFTWERCAELTVAAYRAALAEG